MPEESITEGRWDGIAVEAAADGGEGGNQLNTLWLFKICLASYPVLAMYQGIQVGLRDS